MLEDQESDSQIVETSLFAESRDSERLRESVEKLTKAVEGLSDIFRSASADIHAEAEDDLGKKMDVLVRQNRDIAKALIMILDVQKEYLPRLAEHRKAKQPEHATVVMPVVTPVLPVPEQAMPPPMDAVQHDLEPMMPPSPDYQELMSPLPALPSAPAVPEPPKRKGFLGFGK
ncbi:hypothetical protein HYY74_06190 [Candidatus Woesearchaeota archaeon]|nr:hypothetical protein [Candidatus Woesearchaeota archaeon]